MNEMKNVKPAYATKLGTGVFMAATYYCRKCGRAATTFIAGKPQLTGCPKGGLHSWVKQ